MWLSGFDNEGIWRVHLCKKYLNTKILFLNNKKENKKFKGRLKRNTQLLNIFQVDKLNKSHTHIDKEKEMHRDDNNMQVKNNLNNTPILVSQKETE